MNHNHRGLCRCIIAVEFDAHKPGQDILSQQGASGQELLRSAFKDEEAKSWYSARKRIIKASFAMQDSSDNLLYFRPGDPQGEFDMLPLNVDRTKLLMTSKITKISCGRISNPAPPISFESLHLNLLELGRDDRFPVVHYGRSEETPQ